MISNRKPAWQSRKLWATVIGIVINGLVSQYPEYKQGLLYINGLLIAYILGEAHEGAGNAQPQNINAGVANLTTDAKGPSDA